VEAAMVCLVRDLNRDLTHAGFGVMQPSFLPGSSSSSLPQAASSSSTKRLYDSSFFTESGHLEAMV
jgi:hypothetical protein